MISKIKKSLKGFTLLEILLVVGIIAILAGIVIVAINPSKQIATVRNTQRLSDIKQINSALQQYYINNGSYPNSLLGDLTEICDTGDGTTEPTCTGLIDLSVLVPTYLAAIPKDPLATTTDYTGYQVIKGSTSGLISLNAEHSELGQTIVLGKEAGGGGSSVADCEGGGGVETTDGDYTICTFTESGTFIVNSDIEVEYLVIAGGGGGGVGAGGGGGAGGYRSSVQGESSGGGASAEPVLSVSVGSYSIVIGDGGDAGSYSGTPNGGNGSDSSFDSIVSVGGGGGGVQGSGLQNDGLPGGSGGGGSNEVWNTPGGAGTAGQGYDGGSGVAWNWGSGGGGAGEAGHVGEVSVSSGGGGDGVSSSITGTAVFRAGGGSRGMISPAGGLGGGGASGESGTANTGGGGGGDGGNGGSGIVILRY
jgi:prepilin-type N-terminal cleavage/methylation domain-containing protein